MTLDLPDIPLPDGASLFVNAVYRCVEHGKPKSTVHKHNIAFLATYLPSLKPVDAQRCLRTIENLARQAFMST